MNRETLDRWCERGILALVLAIMVFGPLATGAVRIQDFLVIQGLTVGVAILWGARLWLNPKMKLLWPPLTWVVLAFLAYVVARYFTADVEYVARRELLRFVIYTIIFLAVVNNLHRQESTQIIGITMIFLAMGISCYALYQFFTGSDRVWTFITPYKGRGAGTYICPNHTAGFLEMLLPLALAYVLIGRGKAVTKILVGYSAVAIMAGMGATVSRAGWAACGLSLIFFFAILAMQPSRRLPALLMLALLIGGAAYFASKADPLRRRFQRIDPNELTELDMRYELWQAAVQMWRDHPWFGIGPGHYDTRFRAYRPMRIQLQPDRAHNEYINLLADWGVTGGVIIFAGLTVLAFSVVKTWRAVRRSEGFGSSQSNKFAFVLGATAGLLALLLHSFFDFNMHIPANAILAFTLAALLVSHLRFATDNFWFSARWPAKAVLTLALVSAIVFLGWQEIRLFREHVWLEKASRQSAFSPAQEAFLQKAFAVESENYETTYNIGECYRMQSFEGGENYRELAQKAMEWYSLGMKLNPYDGYNYARYGTCLDWLDRFSESPPYIAKAERLDPNGYFLANIIGWHYVQNGDYAAAQSYYQRSQMLQPRKNDTADASLDLVNRRMLEYASRTNALKW